MLAPRLRGKRSCHCPRGPRRRSGAHRPPSPGLLHSRAPRAHGHALATCGVTPGSPHDTSTARKVQGTSLISPYERLGEMRGLVLIFLAVAFVAASAGPAGASTALGEGDDFDAVTDQEGTTHVVWDESAANQDDKLGYCRVKRGETTCGDLRTLE